MSVRWTDAALDDLRDIESYFSRRSPAFARGVIDGIFGRTGSLADQPMLGAVVPEFDDVSLRELFEHPYRIVYRLTEDGNVDVVGVVHSSRRMPGRLRG